MNSLLKLALIAYAGVTGSSLTQCITALHYQEIYSIFAFPVKIQQEAEKKRLMRITGRRKRTHCRDRVGRG